MAKSSEQPAFTLISPETLLHLRQLTARLGADVPHPAAFAGCFLHLREGDAVWPRKYATAAKLTPGVKLAESAAPAKAATELEQVVEMSQAQAKQNPKATLLAILREKELLAADAVALGRKLARLHLPVVLASFGRAMPHPGEPQKRIGIPEIFVAADDAVAVYRVAEESFWRTRTGVGPTWIRCVT